MFFAPIEIMPSTQRQQNEKNKERKRSIRLQNSQESSHQHDEEITLNGDDLEAAILRLVTRNGGFLRETTLRLKLPKKYSVYSDSQITDCIAKMLNEQKIVRSIEFKIHHGNVLLTLVNFIRSK